MGDTHGNPHAIRRGHLTEEAFKLNASQIAIKQGYLFESHEAVTGDGFILEVFRIRNKHFAKQYAKDVNGSAQPVVFLQHGFVNSADCWIVTHAEEAPAFVLANEGYDVWLGNSRGNSYSRRHQKYDPDGPSKSHFWDFSWYEMGRYDIKA